MNIYGKFKKHVTRVDGTVDVIFTVPNSQMKQVEKLKTDKHLKISLKNASKRSSRQNRFLWGLLRELEAESEETAYMWYIKALKATKAQVEYLGVLKEGVSRLKQTFRAVEELGEFKTEDGTTLQRVGVYIGSSKFNKDEMAKLLETVIAWCYEYGIDAVTIENYINGEFEDVKNEEEQNKRQNAPRNKSNSHS
jgi:hypothetical protein